MKRKLLAAAGALVLLLSACGRSDTWQMARTTTGGVGETEPAGSAVVVDGPPWFDTFRVVDSGEDGTTLLLAGNGGGAGEVYSLNVADKELDAPLLDGELINVYFETVLETYPGQFSGVSKVEHTETQRDDRCGLYLQVLEDLWAVDPGLNANITELGVDLSGVTDLSEAEKAAIAHRFGEKHGLMPVTGTWEELCDQGYIDRENLYWAEGCLFSITGTAETFDAEKWASGLGAYFFQDCTGDQGRDGTWTYEVGGHAIA